MAGVRRRRRRVPLPLLLAVFLAAALAAVFAAVQLAASLGSYSSAGREYEALRLTRASAAEETARTLNTATPEPTTTYPGQGLAEINPDYIGGIAVTGTAVDYPVVRGGDNEKYLTTTFEGNENKLGALFMDYRCTQGFDGRHTVVYGHNARYGSMFGSLSGLLDAGEYPDIQITTADGESRVYRVFAARETDITDPAYRLEVDGEDDFLNFAAMLGAPDSGRLPEGATRILTLATCTNGPDKNDLLLVHAALQ